MSLDEVNAIIKAKNEKNRDEWDKVRMLCFYNVVSQNGSKVFKKPSDLFSIPGETKTKKEPKQLSKEELKAKANKAWQKIGR
jgi:hypothetical protein